MMVNITISVLLPTVLTMLFEYAVSIWVSAILFHLFFWQNSIPILLLSGALVKSDNNNITVTERVKTRTVVLHLK